MRINFLFIGIILIVLLGECFVHDQTNKEFADFWSNNFRIASWLLMGLWYYQLQKMNFGRKQLLFLISIILPIIVSLTSYLMLERTAIIINIIINGIIFGIWIYYFHNLGARVNIRDTEKTLNKISPAFFLFPLLFYFFSLYQTLTGIYTILVFLYVLIFSYTGIVAVFLPVSEERKLYIILALSLLVIANIMNAYHTFLQKLLWAYPVIRTITVASKCMLIYGITDFEVKTDKV
ncbi:hypothetical protein [Emticicia aquatilis]|nr:hypothetical protein [Emticicia aquatilis]